MVVVEEAEGEEEEGIWLIRIGKEKRLSPVDLSVLDRQRMMLLIDDLVLLAAEEAVRVHSAVEEVQFDALLHKLEKGTNRKSKKPPAFAARGMSIIARLKITGGTGLVCVERFEDYPQMGRFTLRDQGQTIAIGKVTKLIMA